MRIYANQGDTVDAVVWRHYGATRGIVEQVFSANPGLADIGPLLPIGHPIELPELPSAPATQNQTINLWD